MDAAFAMTKADNEVTTCPAWTYTTTWSGTNATEIAAACAVDLSAKTVTCESADSAQANFTATLNVKVA